MGANSNHYEDVLVWIEKIINSCQTIKHCNSCEKLITNFEERFQNKLEAYKHARNIRMKLFNIKSQKLLRL